MTVSSEGEFASQNCVDILVRILILVQGYPACCWWWIDSFFKHLVCLLADLFWLLLALQISDGSSFPASGLDLSFHSRWWDTLSLSVVLWSSLTAQILSKCTADGLLCQLFSSWSPDMWQMTSKERKTYLGQNGSVFAMMGKAWCLQTWAWGTVCIHLMKLTPTTYNDLLPPVLPHLKFPQLPTSSPAAGDHLLENHKSVGDLSHSSYNICTR